MKINITNFGPISELSFDLDKDLHLIFGKNAIGKSYGAYCIYSILKNFKSNIPEFFNPYYFYFRNEETEIYKLAKEVVNSIKKSKQNQFINLDSLINKFLIDHFSSSLLGGIKNSFQNTFSSLENLKNRYSNKNYSIEIDTGKEKLIIGSEEDGTPKFSKIDLGISIEGILKNTKTTKFSLYVNHKKGFGVSNEKKFIQNFILFITKKIRSIYKEISGNIEDIYFLPASRSGLYQALNAFTPIMAELSQNRFFIQNKNIELPSLPEPLSDYFIDLSTLDKKHLNKEFNNVINEIENDILYGKVDYDDVTKRIIYTPKGLDLKLDLSEASSMVSELSPIVVFLRHIIKNKFQPNEKADFFSYHYGVLSDRKRKNFSIIFIEEPEAHLHPSVQVKMMNIFSKLIKLGIKIIMTSHSNYMFNKINNLILGQEIDNNKIAVYHLITSSQGCVVNKGMAISEEGIYDDNFTDITKELYTERINILNKSE